MIALDVFVAVDIVVGFIVEDFFKMLKFIDLRVTDILVVVDMAVQDREKNNENPFLCFMLILTIGKGSVDIR